MKLRPRQFSGKQNVMQILEFLSFYMFALDLDLSQTFMEHQVRSDASNEKQREENNMVICIDRTVI